MNQGQQRIEASCLTKDLVFVHLILVFEGLAIAVFYLFFAKIEASNFILFGYLIAVSLLIFSSISVCKWLRDLVDGALGVKDLTKYHNDYLIAFGTIGICSIILRFRVYFVRYSYESEIITTLIYLVTTISIYYFFVDQTFDKKCTWIHMDQEAFHKYVRTSSIFHVIVLIACIRIAVEYDIIEAARIITYQIGCSFASAITLVEFARVWRVGLRLINVNDGGNEVAPQPVESRRPINKTKSKSEPEPLGKAVAPKPSCNICSIPYTENGIRTPRIIKACGHTICEHCADNLLEVKKDNFLKCPFCLKVTVVNGPAAILAKNFALLEFGTEVGERIKDINKTASTGLTSS